MKRVGFRVHPTDRNSSGRIGVFRTVRANGKAVWVAIWRDPETNRDRRAQFSIHRFGEDGARERAERKRAEMERILAQLFGNPGATVQPIQSARAQGFQVRWREPVTDGFEPVSLFFSYGKHGGEPGAREAAEAFADGVRARLGLDFANQVTQLARRDPTTETPADAGTIASARRAAALRHAATSSRGSS